MFFVSRRAWSVSLRRTGGAVLVTCGVLLWLASPASAETVRLALVQTIDTSAYSPSSPDPSGIAYMPAQDRFLISDSEVEETPQYQGFNLYTATRTGSGFGSGNLAPTINREPSGIAFNPADNSAYTTNDDKDRITRIQPGPDGLHGTADDGISHFSTSAFGSTDPEGVEYDPASGRIAICDGFGREIHLVDPVNEIFGDGDDLVTSFDLARYGLTECEGLGLDQSRNALLAVDWTTDAIYEFSMNGELLRTLDLSAIPTAQAIDQPFVAGVTMAPSSDPTDSPSAMNYWIVDRHVDNKANPNENDGLLYEMTVPVLLDLPISSGRNDADQARWGAVRRSTGDIKLGTGAGNAPATAALRFTGVQIPNGATILSAQVQFTVDEPGGKVTNLVIRAERADNSAPITTAAFNISSRARTSAAVAWAPPAWRTAGAEGPRQRTPNLTSVVQRIVNRPGWAAGNALTVIFTGSGSRTAESFEGGAPPVLRVKYVTP